MGVRTIVRASSAMLAAGMLVSLGPVAAQQPPDAAQQSPPSVTFQTEVSYIDIDAVVTDERGEFVSGLTKDDFELLEDGRPQEIATFSLVDIPLPASATSATAPRTASDVRSNAQPISGRLYVIVLDDLNVAPLRTKTVVAAARQFIERHFGPEDIAAITYTSGRSDGAQEFTSDKALLLAAIDKFVGRKLRSSVIEKADQYFQQHLKELELNANSSDDPDAQEPLRSGTVRGPIGYPDVTTDADDFERGHRARQVLDTLRRLADFMGGIRGRRKALLMFSEGIDYPIYDIFGSPAATTVVMATRDAIATAARSNVSFFAVDPRGLVGMTSETIELTAAAEPQLGFDAKGLLADMYLSQDSLRTLASETGGYAAVNSNNITTALGRIVRATSTYYLLGYYPKESPKDGRFHKIEVRVRRPGVRVSARKGYVSPRPLSASELREQERARERGRGQVGDVKTSVELREILTQPLQRNGLTFTVHAAPFRTSSRDASVALAVELDASRLRFTEGPNKSFADGVELSMFALDERGRQHGGAFYQFNLNLRPDTYARVKGSIVRMNPRMTLRPGRYQVRIGLRESGNGEMGSVFYDLIVPDFSDAPLTMSGLLLTDGASRSQFTAHPDTELGPDALPSPAISRRSFARGDVISLFAEVYDNAKGRDRAAVDVATTLTGSAGVAAFSSRETIDPSAPGQRDSRSTSIAIARSIPLKDVRPGSYVLKIEARRRGSDAAVSRETTVRVE